MWYFDPQTDVLFLGFIALCFAIIVYVLFFGNRGDRKFSADKETRPISYLENDDEDFSARGNKEKA